MKNICIYCGKTLTSNEDMEWHAGEDCDKNLNKNEKEFYRWLYNKCSTIDLNSADRVLISTWFGKSQRKRGNY